MDDQRTRRVVARALTGVLLDAPAWEREALVGAARDLLPDGSDWLGPLVDLVLRARPGGPGDDAMLLDVVEGLMPPLPTGVIGPTRAARRDRPPAVTSGGARSVSAPWRARLPELTTPDELGAWLGLDVGQVLWLADMRGLERRASDEALRNYRYGWRIRAGGGSPRVIERPKERLKAVQRHLLHGLLERVPVHPAAHGFVRGRSALTHARAHVGRRVVLGADLQDFFATIPARRIRATFVALGYPDVVAALLTGLCTNALPPTTWLAVPRPTGGLADLARHHRFGRTLAAPHLPQGAPTSPALANLVAFGLDRRLTALARRWDAHYTRYADDLVVSGGARLLRDARAFRVAFADVIADEGFVRNRTKDHLATSAGRQAVCGITVNVRTNPSRSEYDRLKALLHNAARDGPASQDRRGREDFRAHVLGRIAWVTALNPERGARLKHRFEAVDWDA